MNDRSDVLVVGGGLGGLAAATLLARQGRRVKLLERASRPGGRALSLPVGGASGPAMNLGPRALYRGGPAERLLADLGVRWTGFSPTTGKLWLAEGADVFPGPSSVVALLVSRRFSWSERRSLLAFFARLDTTRRESLAKLTTRAWLDGLDGLAAGGRARRFLESMIRLGTYANAPDQLPAAAALGQLQTLLGLRAKGVAYLDGGWQTLVDQLAAIASAAGVVTVTRRDLHAHRGGRDRHARFRGGAGGRAGDRRAPRAERASAERRGSGARRPLGALGVSRSHDVARAEQAAGLRPGRAALSLGALARAPGGSAASACTPCATWRPARAVDAQRGALERWLDRGDRRAGATDVVSRALPAGGRGGERGPLAGGAGARSSPAVSFVGDWCSHDRHQLLDAVAGQRAPGRRRSSHLRRGMSEAAARRRAPRPGRPRARLGRLLPHHRLRGRRRRGACRRRSRARSRRVAEVSAEAPLEPWIFRVATRLSIDRLRRRRTAGVRRPLAPLAGRARARRRRASASREGRSAHARYELVESATFAFPPRARGADTRRSARCWCCAATCWTCRAAETAAATGASAENVRTLHRRARVKLAAYDRERVRPDAALRARAQQRPRAARSPTWPAGTPTPRWRCSRTACAW